MTSYDTLYRIEHVTRFRYSEPIREAVVTLYLEPRSDASQHLKSFQILTDPGAELGATRTASETRSIFSTCPASMNN